MSEKLLKEGSLSDNRLERSVLKHIGNNGNTFSRAGIGYDSSVMTDGLCVTNVVQTDSKIADAFSYTVSEMAYLRAMNNLYTVGAAPFAIQVSVIAAPNVKEGRYRKEMDSLINMAAKENVAITGGHTEVSRDVTGYIVNITALGRTENEKLAASKLKAGDKIIMTGYAGEASGHILSVLKRDELRTRFSESYLEDALMDRSYLSVKTSTEIAIENGAKYIHDVTFGGVYRAISEISGRTGHGVRVGHRVMAVKQPTIELAEFYHINPYEIFGMGGLIIVCDSDKADTIVEKLSIKGVNANIIGELTVEKEKVVFEKELDINRQITAYDGDEIYNII